MPDETAGFQPDPGVSELVRRLSDLAANIEPAPLRDPAPAGGVLICGLPSGDRLAWKCPCCGMESDDKEDFAVTACWECAAGNVNCETCIRMGVEIGRHSSSRGKAHRFSTWDPPGVAALTTCGMHIAAPDIGGTLHLQPCRRCWPATTMEAAA